MITTILTFVLLAGSYFVIEVLVRQRPAKSMGRGRSDRGSTVAIMTTYAASLLLLVILSITGTGSLLSGLIGWIGLSVMLFGLALHVWSMRVLGTSYSRTLRTTEEQQIVDRGPYRLIRHPGYLASILIWAGAALGIANWIAVLVVTALIAGVYVYRINVEETMLLATFGEKYAQYKKRSWRLLPLFY